MKLDSEPPENMLPPRFDRLYQPEKLVQFDKHFAKLYATPLRLSHSAQHAQSVTDDGEIIRSAMSTKDDALSPQDETNHKSDYNEYKSEKESTINDFIHQHGFGLSETHSLPHFMHNYEAGSLSRNNQYYPKKLSSKYIEEKKGE